MECPCKDCTVDRSPTCHIMCERYLVWRKWHDAERQKMAQARQMDDLTYTIAQRGIRELTKRYWRK